MKQMDGEKELQRVGGLLLSTHRVRYQAKRMGAQEVRSIMLEQLCSCVMKYKRRFIYLLFALIAFGNAGMFSVNNEIEAGAACGVVGIVFIILFIFHSYKVLELSSAGAKINAQIKGAKVNDINEFIDSIESAKNTRYGFFQDIDPNRLREA